MAWRTSSQAANYYYDRDPMTTASELGTNITFVGEGANSLGLQGQMQDRQELINLLTGMSPDGSTQLRKLHFDEKGDGIRAAFDKPIDVPKSISLLATLRPDIADKMQGVIESVAEYAANNHCFARVTEGGETRMVKGQGIVAVAHHSMARGVAGIDKDADPHMHGHMLIMGVMCPDGKVRAMETDNNHKGSLLHRDSLKEQQQMAYNGFASVLKSAGIEVEYRVNAGGLVIPEVASLADLNEMFSSRHNAINSVDMDALRERYPNMAQSELEMMAELRTKTAKDTNITHRDVVENIRELVPDIGERIRSIDGQRLPDTGLIPEQHVKEALGNLMEYESVVSVSQLRTEAMKLSITDGIGFQEIDKTIDKLVTNNEILNHQGYVTTPERVEQERNLIQTWNDLTDTRQSFMSKVEANSLLDRQEEQAGFKLSLGQREASVLALTTHDGVVAIQGDAGSGKSTVFGMVNTILAERNVQALGIAPTGTAANELGTVGINAMTVDMFLIKYEAGKIDLSKPTLLIMDEAGMVGIDHSCRIAEIVKDNPNVILASTGDVKQLKPVSAGDTFGEMQSNVTTVVINQVNRQKFVEQRATLAVLKRHIESLHDPNYDGRFGKEYIEKLKTTENNKFSNLNVDMTTSEGKEAVVKWFVGEMISAHERLRNGVSYISSKGLQETATLDNPDVMGLVPTNALKAEILPELRQALQENGYISTDEKTFTTRQPVRMTSSERRHADNYTVGNGLALNKEWRDYKAGSEFEIVERDLKANSVTLRDGNGTIVTTDNLRNEELSVKQWTITETTFAVGERVQYLENNNTKEGRAHGITNSSRHEILGWTDDNKALLFNGKHQYVTDLQDTMVANGTMSTIHGSQGKSPDGIVGYLPSGNMLNVNAEYVNDTRHKYLLSCATDNIEAFMTGINRQDTKASALELVEAMQQLEAVNSTDSDNNISRILNSLSDDTKDSATRHQNTGSRGETVESDTEQRGMSLA